MAFNAMVTNSDDHPRNHALLHTPGGWRLSPAYDIVPVPLVSQERRDLAMDAGRFGRAASRYNLLSRCEVFGLENAEAGHLLDAMQRTVADWRALFAARGVEPRSIEMLESAILPASFLRDTPPDPI
jgi:serine/threonine-protein kinase HipA